jgi:hypothetical protein
MRVFVAASFTCGAGAVMVLPQSEHIRRYRSSAPAVNSRPNQRNSRSVAVDASHTGHAQSGQGTPVTKKTGTR